MTVTPLPTPPSSSDPTNFSARADAFMAALPAFAEELNALGIVMDNGGLVSIPYTFSTTTTDSDPGAGALRLNNATQNLATVIRADLLSSASADFTVALDAMDDSTSTVKGFILLYETSTPANFLLFSVTSVAAPSGYRNITVVCIGFSAANPFANSDGVTLKFLRNGDKGDTGASGTSSLDFSSSGTGNVTPPAAPAANCVGYIGAPQNIQNGNYTFVMADLGKHIWHDSATGGHQYTLPANASVAFPIGAILTVASGNGATFQIIRAGGVVLVAAGTTTDANVTINAYGVVSLLKVATNVWIISGTGFV